MMGKTHTLKINEARAIALKSQLLDSKEKLSSGIEGVNSTIRTLGYVQIDTISVVERAHHHVLWTRNKDYRKEMLHELQTQKRKIFEYWGHAASYLPMEDYRFYLHRMKSFPDGWNYWTKDLYEQSKKMMAQVLERIRKEGPLSSADFESEKNRKQDSWWDWKPAKTALEMLFWKGDLMVKERKNFQRIYDLTERVLPSWVDTSTPDMGDVGRFLIHRALNAHGLARAKEIRDHIHLADLKTIEAVLRDMVETEEVLSVKMENTDNMEYYLLPGTLEKTGARKKINMRLELLSPFDNLVIQRDRLKRIFDFDYQLECYVPSNKRKYGYFMLPVLWGNEFVAKLDPKAKRASNLLLVKKLLFEPGFKDYDAILSPLSILLRQYALFNNLDGIKVEKTVPVFFENMLQKSLR